MHPASGTSSVLTDRVLVVDDDPNFHRLVEAALAETDIVCVCVRSSEEAQRLLIGSVPRAVVVDGLLPGVRGDEFARRLREKHPRGGLPIVFVSAFYRDMKSYKLLTQDCGVDLVLHKPVTMQQLRTALEKVLKRVAFPTAAVPLPSMGSFPVAGAGSSAGTGTGTGKASGTAAGTASGTAAGRASGTAAGTASGTASGTAAGTASGTAAGTASGTAAGTASGAAAGALSDRASDQAQPSNEALLDADDDGIDLQLEDDDLLGGDSPEMLQLRVEYLTASKERVEELRAALPSLSGPGVEDAIHMIRVEAHRFRGSGASFGYPEISRLGGTLEDLIGANDDLRRSGKLRAQLTGLVEALANKVVAIAGSAPILLERKVGSALRRVLLVDAAGSALSIGAQAALEAGQPIDSTAELDEALRRAIETRPDAIFVAAELADAAAIGRLRAGSAAPVVVLGTRDSLEDWLGVLRAGAVGYVARPPDVESLFRLGAFYARPRLAANILAVGGDRSSLSSLAEMLAPKGVAVQPCATTDEFFASLEQAAPALVILDGDLPKAKAIDLLRVLRADVNYRRVPVTIVSRMGDARERIAAFEAGADDWMVRPVPPEELTVRVLAQLARAGVDPLARRDALTGLFDRAYLLDACTRALQLGRRDGTQIALLGIDLGLDVLRRDKGRLAADERLMALGARLLESFRTSDVVARVGPSRLVALLHGAGKADAERLLRDELAVLAERKGADGTQLRPKGAIVVFPEVVGGADSLLASLEAQLAK